MNKNAANEGVIPAEAFRVAIRFIRTDEELVIARSVCHVLGLGMASEKGTASTLQSRRLLGR